MWLLLLTIACLKHAIVELKTEFLDFAYQYYEQYVSNYHISVHASPALPLPLSHIDFAQGETHLFKLLFINDMDLEMTEAKDFIKKLTMKKEQKCAR